MEIQFVLNDQNSHVIMGLFTSKKIENVCKFVVMEKYLDISSAMMEIE